MYLPKFIKIYSTDSEGLQKCYFVTLSQLWDEEGITCMILINVFLGSLETELG